MISNEKNKFFIILFASYVFSILLLTGIYYGVVSKDRKETSKLRTDISRLREQQESARKHMDDAQTGIRETISRNNDNIQNIIRTEETIINKTKELNSQLQLHGETVKRIIHESNTVAEYNDHSRDLTTRGREEIHKIREELQQIIQKEQN